MIAVLQRVRRASVVADGTPAGKIEKGLLILLGVGTEDSERDGAVLAEKIAKLRIFEDEGGKMNLSVNDIGGGALVVSNFTLLANYSHGNRPEYFGAARPDVAIPLYEDFVRRLSLLIPQVETGVFGADMTIDMEAWGPVTIVMDSEKLRK
jgi:D-tyrosyl-tRNA(Tyr) deacylase